MNLLHGPAPLPEAKFLIGERMHRYRNLASLLVTALVSAAMAACVSGPTVTGSFDRSFTVSGHTRLALTNASGDISITGSGDGQVHVHGDVRASGSNEQAAREKLSDVTAHPPVEQTSEGVRIGSDLVRLRNVSIAYTIEVPRDTEVSSSVASGAQTVRNLRGPIKLQSASGSLRAEHIDGEAQLNSLSGTVTASDIGDTLRASSASGDITVDHPKNDARLNVQSGNIRVSNPGGRVEAEITSGNVDVFGAAGDVKLRGISGRLSVQGNPAATSFWELRNVSGGIDIAVPPGANFHLLAEASTGGIRADIPIVIEEQGKHSLRAQVGTGGGRIEVHNTSGEIHLLSK
jgi:DUF4097 and DUF4098 domain-containing protein YvlB